MTARNPGKPMPAGGRKEKGPCGCFFDGDGGGDDESSPPGR